MADPIALHGAVLLRQVKGLELDANTLVNILKVGGANVIQFKGMPADARMVGFVQDALSKNKVVLIIESKEFPLVGATGKLPPLKVEAQTFELPQPEPEADDDG
jgi:hypothetical protein